MIESTQNSRWDDWQFVDWHCNWFLSLPMFPRYFNYVPVHILFLSIPNWIHRTPSIRTICSNTNSESRRCPRLRDATASKWTLKLTDETPEILSLSSIQNSVIRFWTRHLNALHPIVFKLPGPSMRCTLSATDNRTIWITGARNNKWNEKIGPGKHLLKHNEKKKWNKLNITMGYAKGLPVASVPSYLSAFLFIIVHMLPFIKHGRRRPIPVLLPVRFAGMCVPCVFLFIRSAFWTGRSRDDDTAFFYPMPREAWTGLMAFRLKCARTPDCLW